LFCSHIPLHYQLICMGEIPASHSVCSVSPQFPYIVSSECPLSCQSCNPVRSRLIKNCFDSCGSLYNMFFFGRSWVHHHLISWIILCNLTVTSL
jgi:hypothetical protein